MNKVSSINLGGYPFTIDEDAYEYLRQYLDAIHRHFRGVEGNEEITSDIETRLAELFQASLGNRPIVIMKDVKDAVAVMGAPEDFGAEPLSENPKGKFNIKTGKRLFRNPEEEVIGGVCSGIAAYFGIQDPLWVRLFFVVVAISGGFGVPLYIILWAIMPKPKTASDWLAMRGEPINFSNIGRIIQEEVERLSGKISEFGEEMGGGSKKAGSDGKDSFKEGMDAVGNALRGAGDSLQYLWKPVLYIVGFFLVLFFALAWIGSATGLFFVYPFLDFLFPGKSGFAMLSIVNLFLIVGIPLISLVLLVSRLLFGTRVSTGWRTGLSIMWGISITSFFLLGSLFGRQFSDGGQFSANAGSYKGDTLYVTAPMETAPIDTWYNIDNEVMLADDKLIVRNVHLSIAKAEGTTFELVKEVSARGENNAEANALANTTITDARFEGNQLNISPYYSLTKGQKWRVQDVKYILKVPEGKFVKFTTDNPWSMMRDIELADDTDFWEHPNRLWKMSADGLACTDCPKEVESDLSFNDFHTVNISGKLKVIIEQGDEYQVELRGAENNRENVTMAEADGHLTVNAGSEISGSPVRLYITVPELKTITTNATDDVQIKGFNNPLQVNANGGGYEVKIYGDASNLKLTQEGENKIDLIGSFDLLEATLLAGARLEAEKPGVREAIINASTNSRADLMVREKLTQKKDDSSRIRVKGNPEVVEQ
ncbi:MAG: GIN domain-containing protein [Saprospiraceae bacterium]